MKEIGDRVQINDKYTGYKSMRGFWGVIIWKGILGGHQCYQIQTDKYSPKTGRNTCFVSEDDLN